MASPTSTAMVSRLTRDILGALDLGNDGTIGAGVLVAREAEAVARAGLLVGFPVGAFRGGADHVLGPLVRQMAQPEIDRILAALDGEFVEKGLDRKNIALRAQRPQRGGSDRHGQQAMAFDSPGRKIIERDRIAIATAAVGLRRIGGDGARKRICQLGSGKQRRRSCASRPRGMTVAPDGVTPIDDLVLRIEIGLDLDRHRRPERRMRHLVFARPLHPDRPAAGRSSPAAPRRARRRRRHCAHSSRRLPYARP